MSDLDLTRARRFMDERRRDFQAPAALDAFFLRQARQTAMYQPRADDTIGQLLNVGSVISTDLIPIFRNGFTYAANAPTSSIPILLATADLSAIGIFNVKAYGAVGNGTNDDTQAIQAAINAAGPVGGTVWFPPGTYKITSTLIVNNFNTIILLGAGPSSIIAPVAGIGFAMRVTGCHWPVLKDFSIVHPATEHSDKGIYINADYFITMIDVVIDFSIAAYSSGTSGVPNGTTLNMLGGFIHAHYRGRGVELNDGNTGGFIGNFNAVTETPAATTLTADVGANATVLPLANVTGTNGYGVMKAGDTLWIQDGTGRAKTELVIIQSISGLNVTLQAPGTVFSHLHTGGTTVTLCAQPTNAALQLPVANTAGRLDTLNIDGFYTQGFYNGIRATPGATSLGNAPLYWRGIVSDGNVAEGLLVSPVAGGGGIGGFTVEQSWFTSETADDVLFGGNGGINDVNFEDCDFPQAQKNGYRCSNINVTRVYFTNVRAEGASNAGSNLYSGFQLDAGTSWHKFVNCYSDPPNFNRQKYGVNFGVGVSRMSVEGGEYTGCVTAPIGIADSFATFASNGNLIRNAMGFNPYGPLTAPAVPATTVVLNNPFPFDVMVYITTAAGGVTVAVGGLIGASATIASTAGTGVVIPVQLRAAGSSIAPGNPLLFESIKLTYTNAPTWTWVN